MAISRDVPIAAQKSLRLDSPKPRPKNKAIPLKSVNSLFQHQEKRKPPVIPMGLSKSFLTPNTANGLAAI